MQRFTNRVVMVTGAGSGIGRAAAVRIAAEGGSVYCVDISQAGLDDTVATISAAGGEATGQCCDVSDETQVKDTVAACVARYGSLYALVNMAGILRFDDTDAIALDAFQRVIAVNLTGTLLLCREVLPHLMETRGSIVNAASTAALAGLPCGAAYSASKGGVLAMTRSIAVEFAKRGVRANCVCPGDINSGMTTGIEWPPNMDFELIGRISSLSGPKDAEVMAGVIAMLASEDAVHITGEDIRVDGGTLS
ncbi:MAG: short-chain dehydrogenase [Haliea sp.]|jgi:NAD(P)-dependent dehydrogenase (short-subunit alcohol dehydrogenase family)|uniref:SDR family NAD(P)-dependent oxidoreductase n=1 Tax=Haliea sp. TaxID=1932666 RepID=UPI000C524967|nr:SDR family NAD(P)-dependent oxidoreductase [Haliea sp.]MBM69299.1 short-chain dehydrogenase [Haliea sp.]